MSTPTKKPAKIITPPNILRAKVGSGGLSDEILDKAQKLLEENAEDFAPLADIYLTRMLSGIDKAKGNPNFDEALAYISYPCAQLKANGGMFHYSLITAIAQKLALFLKEIKIFNDDSIEIITAFHTAMRAVIMGKITGDGGEHGSALLKALDEACERYISMPNEGS